MGALPERTPVTTDAPQLTIVHPTQTVTAPGGDPVQIDTEIAPVIKALWAADLTTIMCCQNVGEAMAGGGMRPIPARWSVFLSQHAWLKMPIDSAQALLAMLDKTPEFGPRLPAKAPGGWHSAVWLSPTGLVDYANIYFPSDQLTELAKVLGGLIGADLGPSAAG
jgi:hypothetical protein